MLKCGHSPKYSRRRHIKCDEGRPVCRLCTVSQRDCTFPNLPQPQSNPARSGSSSEAHSPNQDSVNGIDQSLHLASKTSHTTSLSHSKSGSATATTPESFDSGAQVNQRVLQDGELNLAHMELIINLLEDKETFILGGMDWNHYSERIHYSLDLGKRYPYLLHQLLAFSSQRLAYVHPERAESYKRQATALQTHAIALFNAEHIEVDANNCVAVVGFSSVVGHHLLADTMCSRETVILSEFVSLYAQLIRTNQGFMRIAYDAWPLMIDAPHMGRILTWSYNFTSREGKGHQCDPLRNLLKDFPPCNIDEEGMEELGHAVRRLQVGFDSIWSDESETGGRNFQMIYLWTTLISPELLQLLEALDPVGLIIFAYYAVLLHYGRRAWQIRDAGTYILGMIENHLNSRPEWKHWLEWPTQEIRSDREPA